MSTNLKLDGNIQAPYITSNGTNLITVPATTGTMALTSDITGGSIKSWANFNGVAATIYGSSGISSLVRNGLGDYTLYFSTAQANTNYAVLTSCGFDVGAGYTQPTVYINNKYTDRFDLQCYAIENGVSLSYPKDNAQISVCILNT